MAVNKNGYLEQIIPVLAVKDVLESLEFYVQKLGFTLVFVNEERKPLYAVLRRNNVAIHLQWHAPEYWTAFNNKPRIRIQVQAIDDLFEEYRLKGVFHNHTALEERPWGTTEFSFYDPSQNVLIFYQIH
tara:strand:+ start:1195 stop:1581 length:387 start_codon:yes stop_codon:yes gene_type:complete